MENGFTIGQVAKSSGVNVQTIRYYERRRLILPVDRTDSNYRRYGPEEVRKVRFIKNAQALGFSLDEIAALLKLQVSHRARCGDVKAKAEAKRRDVDAKIVTLQAIKQALTDLIRSCRARNTTDRCPILKSLDRKRGE